jgi:hypothetical protein
MQTFSGLPVDHGTDKDGMPKIKPLKITASNARGAAMFAYHMRDRGLVDFFNNRVPGVSFRNGFVRIDQGKT